MNMNACISRTKPWLVTMMVMVSAGCAEDDEGDPAEPRVTYWQDVAPIYFEHCVACHREDGIAPFALDDPDTAAQWADVSAQSVQTRTMPPWLVTDDGSCGTFADSRALTQEEIETITRWADAGAVVGEARDDLQLPAPDELENATTVTTPRFVPEIQGGELAEFDEYRCFAVDPGLAGDAFLSGYAVRPGNEAIVHHVLGFTVDPGLETMSGETNAEVMARLDAESPDRDGWPCFEAAGDGVEPSALPIAWAPGQGVVEFPEDTGMAVGAGSMLVLQVHYNLAVPQTRGQSDATAVDLRFDEDVALPGAMTLPDLFLETLFSENPASLPPGLASVEYGWELPVSALLDPSMSSAKIHGVIPHMHERGRSIRMSIVGAESEACAVDVPRWDFNWQLVYFYDEPLHVDADDVLRVTCDFDTTGASEPVTPGWGTGNEMCLMGLFMVPDSPDSP